MSLTGDSSVGDAVAPSLFPDRVPASGAANSAQWTIRSLRKEDRQPIATLLRETRVFTDDEISIALELIDIVLNDPSQKDYRIEVFESDGAVRGYYCVGPTPATVGTFDLYWIAVDPAFHGQGVGGVLENHAEMLVRSLGGRLLIAETSSTPSYEKTRRFYLHHGYREISRIPEYYRPGDDLVVFGKYLSLHS
jgi:GNAT superfamily N-acetyltransferase